MCTFFAYACPIIHRLNGINVDELIFSGGVSIFKGIILTPAYSYFLIRVEIRDVSNLFYSLCFHV